MSDGHIDSILDSNDSIKVRYWTSSFLGHSTHSNLLKHFNESLPGLDLGKMLQVSMALQ